ncbi:MAG: PIN domain-containing protein [Candidatus Rokuibacteriota bacterium]
MAIVVLDASVVIALLDAGDAHHAAAVASMGQARRQTLVLPASAYAEILVDPSRRGPEAVSVVRRFVADLGIRVEPITTDVAERAARLRARHAGLRLPDALVLATGDALDGTVLTCDRAWPRLNRRARMV